MGKLTTLSEMQLDAIGEIMNISMGSAATAVSELLNAKVWITTPKVTVIQASELNYDRLEPAICVKIEYIKGLSGSNLMILKQDDVQLILNQLMGKPPVISPDFEFDELNISAVSEVMNQMMGASSTALSEFLGMGIDISTPTPYILSEINIADLQNYEQTDKVAAINFDLTIDGVIKSEFISVLDIDLAATLADRMIGGATSPEPIVTEPAPAPAPQPVPQAEPVQQAAPVPQAAPVQQAVPVQQAAPRSAGGTCSAGGCSCTAGGTCSASGSYAAGGYVCTAGILRIPESCYESGNESGNVWSAGTACYAASAGSKLP